MSQHGDTAETSQKYCISWETKAKERREKRKRERSTIYIRFVVAFSLVGARGAKLPSLNLSPRDIAYL